MCKRRKVKLIKDLYILIRNMILECFEKKTQSEKRLFVEEDLKGLDLSGAPEHVAIIMDGNRRWARQKNLPGEYGHAKGAQSLRDIVKAAIELQVKTLTVYAFSTENWVRPAIEVQTLIKLYKEYLIEERDSMVRNGVRLHTIGDLSRFDDQLIELISHTKKATAGCSKLNLVIALNYGGRSEIIRSIKKIAADIKQDKIAIEDISESLVSNYLDTSGFKDPELLIRSSGEFRLSNFLLWQLAYTEVYVSNEFWPSFTPHHFLSAIKTYLTRDRRRGR